MPRLEDLTDVQRQAVLNFPCFEYDGAPFVPLTKPLRMARLALVTTAGMHLRGDRAFTAGDQSYRVIPSSTPVKDIIQSHNSIGFDRTAVYRDLNVTFPMDRLNELVERGIIGSTNRELLFLSWELKRTRSESLRKPDRRSRDFC